jgi:hypothetical protein
VGGRPDLKNKWFTSLHEQHTRPLSTFRSNAGGEPVAGNVTRLNSDMPGLSDFSRKFQL